MHVLSLSLDPSILDRNSRVAQRIIRYGDVLQKYTIVIPTRERIEVVLSEKVTVYGTGGSFKCTQFFRLFIRAFLILKREPFEVITSQDIYFLGLAGVLLSRYFRTGLEIQVHGIEQFTYVRKRIAKWVLSQAGSVRVVSKRIAEFLSRELHVATNKMVLSPIFVDISFLSLPKNEDVSSFAQKYKERFNIVSVNRLVPVKNILMQLQAVTALVDAFPHILLHIVGEGPEKENLEEKIVEMNLQSHVILHGTKKGAELATFFSQCDCFVLTSDFEGYGMVLVEAAAAGACIVTTDVGCAQDIISDGVNGFIVEPRNTKQFTGALRAIINEESTRSSFKAKVREFSKSLPDFDEVMQTYVRSWEQASTNRN